MIWGGCFVKSAIVLSFMRGTLSLREKRSGTRFASKIDFVCKPRTDVFQVPCSKRKNDCRRKTASPTIFCGSILYKMILLPPAPASACTAWKNEPVFAYRKADFLRFDNSAQFRTEYSI